jgi:phosphoenolpyruvate---glycerone phosphotransferase subunit DhaM
MIGIVVVSHSEPLANAAVELASQMATNDPPTIEVAAGNAGELGTDATAIATAIQRADAASGGDGVLVFTDLGSAVLSSEMALEFVDETRGRIYLSRAPLVEGLVAAVVQAAMGRPLAEVEREAVRAVQAKAMQLGSDAEEVAGRTVQQEPGASPDDEASAPAEDAASEHVDVEILNPQGLHARPAAIFAEAAAALPVEVTVFNVSTEKGPAAADSMLELMTIGARKGHVVRLTARGPEAQTALAKLERLIDDGLGEFVDRE